MDLTITLSYKKRKIIQKRCRGRGKKREVRNEKEKNQKLYEYQ